MIYTDHCQELPIFMALKNPLLIERMATKLPIIYDHTASELIGKMNLTLKLWPNN